MDRCLSECCAARVVRRYSYDIDEKDRKRRAYYLCTECGCKCDLLNASEKLLRFIEAGKKAETSSALFGTRLHRRNRNQKQVKHDTNEQRAD